eukprot:gnl/MRDRNA2_/MRDRNA2_162092_c0_seq1.p1 gnl/MRDRNA2_/MRDRNA2_162092_c0~~gnl/MRDRNA2_/MRDRNA2_162092_c0_seq1.p1  ORF type:complete len:115 (-),score=16.32 gnl/MRDRNA2_/MRDRNA2_162092_c0_seq1:143-487(-)
MVPVAQTSPAVLISPPSAHISQLLQAKPRLAFRPPLPADAAEQDQKSEDPVTPAVGQKPATDVRKKLIPYTTPIPAYQKLMETNPRMRELLEAQKKYCAEQSSPGAYSMNCSPN